MALDEKRLVKDLRAGAAEIKAGPQPIPPLQEGFARAWDVMASAIEDGVYDVDPKTRPIEELVTELEGRLRP